MNTLAAARFTNFNRWPTRTAGVRFESSREKHACFAHLVSAKMAGKSGCRIRTGETRGLWLTLSTAKRSTSISVLLSFPSRRRRTRLQIRKSRNLTRPLRTKPTAQPDHSNQTVGILIIVAKHVLLHENLSVELGASILQQLHDMT